MQLAARCCLIKVFQPARYFFGQEYARVTIGVMSLWSLIFMRTSSGNSKVSGMSGGNISMYCSLSSSPFHVNILSVTICSICDLTATIGQGMADAMELSRFNNVVENTFLRSLMTAFCCLCSSGPNLGLGLTMFRLMVGGLRRL